MTAKVIAIRALCTVAAVLAVTAASTFVSQGDAARLSTRASSARWSPLVCRQVADGIARQGLRAVLHYHAPLSGYPADTYLLIVRTGVSGFRRHGCRRAVLARALMRHLTRRQRAELLSHVPPGIARYLRHALATV
jgi:hypothetical protein